MKCIKCSGPTQIKDSRFQVNNTTKRRRRCKKCGLRFSTVETAFVTVPKEPALPKHAPITKAKKIKKKQTMYYPSTRGQWMAEEIDIDSLSDEALEQAVFEGRVNADM